MTPYNLRQLNLMIDRINRYKKELIGLWGLIKDLEGLLNALENYDENWKDEFQSNWIELDVIYAVALDEGISFEDSSVKNDAFQTVDILKEMILSEIKGMILTDDKNL